MFRVAVKLLLAAAVVAAAWAYIPVGGRTLADRWHRARTPAEFAEHGWAELRGPPNERQEHPEPQPARRPPAARPPTQRQAEAGPDQRKAPVETHSESDRRALDRLLSQELQDHPAR